MGIYYGSIWWCGDDICDCYQPQIEHISPNNIAGPPWLRRETLWTGEFITGASWEEKRQIRKELADKMREMKREGIKFSINKLDVWNPAPPKALNGL